MSLRLGDIDRQRLRLTGGSKAKKNKVIYMVPPASYSQWHSKERIVETPSPSSFISSVIPALILNRLMPARLPFELQKATA